MTMLSEREKAFLVLGIVKNKEHATTMFKLVGLPIELIDNLAKEATPFLKQLTINVMRSTSNNNDSEEE